MDLSRISSCTYPVRDRPLADALGVMAAAGLGKVDLWGAAPHFSIVWTDCDLGQLSTTAAAAGMTIANIGSYPGARLGSPDPLVQQAELACLRATLYAARVLGARSIRVMPGRGEDPALVDAITPLFAAAAPLAEELDIRMGMENHSGSIAGSPELAARLCRAVGSTHFGVLYEPCNLMYCGVDYRAALEHFADHIMHVHVKDGRHANGAFVGCHLGEGEIDYQWVIASLDDLGYDGDYALEYEIRDLEAIETGLPRWVQYFRDLN